MAAGDTRAVDPVDTVHHEKDSVVPRSHCFYKSVQSPLIGEQLILEKKPATQSTRLICTRVRGSDKRFSDSWLHSGKILFTDDVVLYYKKGLCRLLSGVCYITGRRKKGKGIVGLFKYNYYCGLTIDPAFIIYIMLYPPTTKQDQTFIRGNTVYMQIHTYKN